MIRLYTSNLPSVLLLMRLQNANFDTKEVIFKLHICSLQKQRLYWKHDRKNY